MQALDFTLTFFVQRLSNNILADIIFFREIEKFSDSASSFGPQTTRHCSMDWSVQEYPSLLFLQ
jgi:hypothetical protein